MPEEEERQSRFPGSFQRSQAYQTTRLVQCLVGRPQCGVDFAHQGAVEMNLRIVRGTLVVLVVNAGWVGCADRLKDGPDVVEDQNGNEPLVMRALSPSATQEAAPVATPAARGDGPRIAKRCSGKLVGCPPDGAEAPLGDVFRYRYQPRADRIPKGTVDGATSWDDCQFDGECEIWGCGIDACGGVWDERNCPERDMMYRYKKRDESYCGCVNGKCRRFEQRRPELVIEFEDIESSLVDRGWRVPNAYERRLIVNAINNAVERPGASWQDPMDFKLDMPTVRQCFKSSPVGTRKTLYLDVTVNDHSAASAVAVRGGSPSLRKCIRERLLASRTDWRPVPGLTGLRVTLHASVVTVPEASR